MLWYIRKSRFFCLLDLPVLWAGKSHYPLCPFLHSVYLLKLNMEKFLFEQHKKSICVWNYIFLSLIVLTVDSLLYFLIPFIHYNFSAWATNHKMSRQRQRSVYVWLLVYKIYIAEEWQWGVLPATILTHPFPSIGSHLCCRTWLLNSSSCMCR